MEMEGEVVQEISLNKVCRTCLTEKNELKSVFSTTDVIPNVELPLTDMLEACTSVQISLEDGLPGLICSGCEESLCSAYSFRQQCLRAEETLRQCTVQVIDNNDLKLDDREQFITTEAEMLVESELIVKTDNYNISYEEYEEERCDDEQLEQIEELDENFEEENEKGDENVNEDENIMNESDSDPTYSVKKKCSKGKTKKSSMKSSRRKSRNSKIRLAQFNPDEVKQVMMATKQKHNQKRECRLCGFISSNARGLSLHIAHIHKEMKNRWCPLCYVEVEDLLEHKKTHSQERLFKCTFCDKMFRAQGHLTEHLRSHLGERPHKCKDCGKGFLSARHLRVHQRIHSGEKPYECSECSRRFTQKGALQGHMLNHTKEKMYKCQVCNERWAKFSLLAEHLVKSGHANEIDPDLLKTAEAALQKKKNSTLRIKQCVKQDNDIAVDVIKAEDSICDQNNTNSDGNSDAKSGELRYVATIIKNPIDKTLCTVCGKTFSNANKLRLHMRVHTGETPYRCEYCNKRFSTRGQQVVHERTHTGEKPHICQICGKGFAQSSVLNTHMKLHTGRPEQCSVCLQRFCRPAELRLHMRKHTGEKPYLCTECGQAFIQSSHLMEHVKTHSDERPYKCQYCERAFKQNSSLRSHVQIHTGEKPYICSQCPYACRQSYSLTQHMRQHGIDVPRPHQCQVCNKRYRSLAMLNAHLRSSHQTVY